MSLLPQTRPSTSTPTAPSADPAVGPVAPTSIDEVVASGAVRSVFQPIVDLETREVVGYEALSRGPVGTPFESPAVLFPAARTAGLLGRLDEACRLTAFRSASTLGLSTPMTVFVNVEPEVLDGAPLADLCAVADHTPGGLRIVLEITERALATRPAELLRTVERVRELGWGVALDDVGAEPASLAFMALLRPDVVKLDLSLVQQRASPAVAEIMNAVNAYAERSGALVLAEGIETEAHLAIARALGATLGQGWLLGRPTAAPDAPAPGRPLRLLPPTTQVEEAARSPFASLPPGTALRRSPKRLLIELSKHLEREALRIGETCVVASTFQYREHFTPATAQRYRDLVERTGFVCALGDGLTTEHVPGLRGATLEADDPVLGEWDVTVLSPQFSAALLARDLGDTGPDMERTFEYALTYERETVTRAVLDLLSRVVPARPGVGGRPTTLPTGAGTLPVTLPASAGAADRPADRPADLPAGWSPPVPAGPGVGEAVLLRALAETSSGLSIADTTRPDAPLVFVNAAFERLAGHPAEQLLGRNCRFLQGEDTDRAAVSRVRAAIREGRECRELLLNYRGPERIPWWNEVHLSPVRDEHGRVVQYMAVQSDVSRRVEAERALAVESDLARGYLARIERLAYTDPLTGLMNRRRFETQVEESLARAAAHGQAVVLLFLDLDGFKTVNDSWGHATGDRLLREVATRLRAVLDGAEPLARLGGDEFVVALTDLDVAQVGARTARARDQLLAALAEPFAVAGHTVTVGASIGAAAFPDDAEGFGALLHLADLRMFALKHPSGPGPS